jgi:hypothetical protein
MGRIKGSEEPGDSAEKDVLFLISTGIGFYLFNLNALPPGPFTFCPFSAYPIHPLPLCSFAPILCAMGRMTGFNWMGEK